MQIGIAITGCGSATGSVPLNNEMLSQIVDTSDEWITTRTGIKERRLVSNSESLTSIASQSAMSALSMSGITPDQLDLILLASSTPEDLFGTACRIQVAIGATHAVAFDLTAACSGFVFAMVTAAQYIKTGVYQRVLVIGADVLSRWVDWSDRTTCILFGDGAGAVVMEASAKGDRYLGFEIRSDGTQNNSLNLEFAGSESMLLPGTNIVQGGFLPIKMNGKEIYRFAVQKVPEVIEKALFRYNITTKDIDWLILHQANQRILNAVADRLEIPADKVISNVARYGNTSAASIPLALDEAVREGKIKTGDTIAIAGFGAGLSWGAAVFKWN